MAKAQFAAAYRHIPKFLRKLRENAGLTQRALGERLDKPQSFIHNCEIGARRVDLPEFARWTRACEVEPLEAVKQFLRDCPL